MEQPLLPFLGDLNYNGEVNDINKSTKGQIRKHDQSNSEYACTCFKIRQQRMQSLSHLVAF